MKTENLNISTQSDLWITNMNHSSSAAWFSALDISTQSDIWITNINNSSGAAWFSALAIGFLWSDYEAILKLLLLKGTPD